MLANLEFEIMYFETDRHDPRDILSVLQTTQKLLRQYVATRQYICDRCDIIITDLIREPVSATSPSDISRRLTIRCSEN